MAQNQLQLLSETFKLKSIREKTSIIAVALELGLQTVCIEMTPI